MALSWLTATACHPGMYKTRAPEDMVQDNQHPQIIALRMVSMTQGSYGGTLEARVTLSGLNLSL